MSVSREKMINDLNNKIIWTEEERQKDKRGGIFGDHDFKPGTEYSFLPKIPSYIDYGNNDANTESNWNRKMKVTPEMPNPYELDAFDDANIERNYKREPSYKKQRYQNPNF